jgi:hypothetical protein
MSPPHVSTSKISKKEKGKSIVGTSGDSTPVVPKKWADIKCIRSCLWVDEGVVDIPSNVEDKEDLKIIKNDWRSCFHLYPPQVRTESGIATEKDVNLADTYQMIPVEENERVCYPAAENEKPHIMVYHGLFNRIRVCFPFSTFQMEVLNYLQVAPTQLHPNGWGFIQAFETFCWAQEWHYSSSLFRVLFQPYRKDKKKKEWISLRQSDNPSLFTCYEESFKD